MTIAYEKLGHLYRKVRICHLLIYIEKSEFVIYSYSEWGLQMPSTKPIVTSLRHEKKMSRILEYHLSYSKQTIKIGAPILN
jgi:hypothetical protein